jgi:hypothetical protein
MQEKHPEKAVPIECLCLTKRMLQGDELFKCKGLRDWKNEKAQMAE